MNHLKHFQVTYVLTVAISVAALIGCVPLTVTRPTLDEVRLGKVRGTTAEDTTLRPGEIRAEVLELNPARREIRVETDEGRREVLAYDTNRTRVTYHGWDYTAGSLESGDIIAFAPPPTRSSYVDTIRIQEPVQARADRPGVARRSPPPSRSDVIEGRVERIQPDLGVFDVAPRAGRTVTVTVPYNARPAEVENFRRLKRGDFVRVEGEFVNPESFQLLSFLSPRVR